MLNIENVVKQYANHRALDSVSMRIKKGSVFGLLGPNGAGKTTLIRIINQITAPDSGSISLDGKLLQPSDISRIGYLPEERGLYKKMKVGEQSLYLAMLKGLTRKVAEKRLHEWFIHLDITGWWDKKVEELSKGMQQKVQFVTTVVHNPDLLIFDEPFSGFDPINTEILKKEILSLRDRGATIVFSTHNMGSVEEICDDIALINNSKVILHGNVSEIKNSYRNNKFALRLENSDKPLSQIIPAGCEILEPNGVDVGETLVKLSSGFSPNLLLQNLMNHATVLGFREVLPSMNDIFIQRVNETNQKI